MNSYYLVKKKIIFKSIIVIDYKNFMLKKKYNKRLSWVDSIYRVRGPFETRLNKLRLDKNERVKYFYLKEPRVRPQNLHGNRSFLVGVGVI